VFNKRGHILTENENEVPKARESRRRGGGVWGGGLPLPSRQGDLGDFERAKRCWWHLRCQPSNIQFHCFHLIEHSCLYRPYSMTCSAVCTNINIVKTVNDDRSNIY